MAKDELIEVIFFLKSISAIFSYSTHFRTIYYVNLLKRESEIRL
jgi:hypothetical protein